MKQFLTSPKFILRLIIMVMLAFTLNVAGIHISDNAYAKNSGNNGGGNGGGGNGGGGNGGGGNGGGGNGGGGNGGGGNGGGGNGGGGNGGGGNGGGGNGGGGNGGGGNGSDGNGGGGNGGGGNGGGAGKSSTPDVPNQPDKSLDKENLKGNPTSVLNASTKAIKNASPQSAIGKAAAVLKEVLANYAKGKATIKDVAMAMSSTTKAKLSPEKVMSVIDKLSEVSTDGSLEAYHDGRLDKRDIAEQVAEQATEIETATKKTEESSPF